MTMEVILSTAFGRSIDVQGGKGGEVYEAARGLFASIGESSGKYIRYLQFIICKDFVIKYRRGLIMQFLKVEPFSFRDI